MRLTILGREDLETNSYRRLVQEMKYPFSALLPELMAIYIQDHKLWSGQEITGRAATVMEAYFLDLTSNLNTSILRRLLRGVGRCSIK